MGQVAIRTGMLSTTQVFSVVNAQVDTPKLFGESALELGFLTEETLAELIEYQLKTRPKIGAVLVEQGVLSQVQVEAEFEAYSAYLRKSDNETP